MSGRLGSSGACLYSGWRPGRTIVGTTNDQDGRLQNGLTMTDDALEVSGSSDDGFNLELAVSALASNATDVRIMLKLLVSELASALSGRLQVERPGGLRRRSEEIRAVQVVLGDDVLRAEVDGASVRCTIGHSSGGIRIRSEQVDMGTWLKRLLGALQAEAAQSETTRLALENIMIGGT